MAKIYTTVYSNFKGVDMASDPTKIDNSRSPYAPNLVSDNDNFPEKRVGWRRLYQVDSPVNGIFYAKLKGEKYYFVHGGTKLYRWNLSDAPQEIEGVQIRNGKSSGFVFNDKFYLLTGAEYLVCESVANLDYVEGNGEPETVIQVKDATEDAFIPTVVIGRAPSGGGTALYGVNLLQKKRINSFLADGSAKVYQLTSDNIESVDEVLVGDSPATAYTVDRVAGTVTFTTAPTKPAVTGQDNVKITFSKINYKTTKKSDTFTGTGSLKEFQLSAAPIAGVDEVTVGGVVQQKSAYKVDLDAGTVTFTTAPTNGKEISVTFNDIVKRDRRNTFSGDGSTTTFQLSSSLVASVDEVSINGEILEASEYTVDLAAGTVTFAEAPAMSTGVDNISIAFQEMVDNYKLRILGCTICTQYGYGNTDRVIVSGNPDYPNTDWISNINDPTYFPDMNYSNVGVSGTAIMGYARVGEYLAIIKEDNAQDSTIFFRSATYDGTTITFPLKQGIAGIGAIAPGSFATIDDEPLFLARTGVYAITSNLINAERTVQNRSYYVDPALTKEPNLAGAIAVNWNNKYLVCVNNNCYVLDGNQPKSYVSKTNGDYIYECYHWNNIPAVCFFEHDGDLYFGKADGWICRFNNDLAMSERPMEAYSDNWRTGETEDNSEAIYCQWATKADDDGDFMTLKTMPKKGSGIQIKPYQRSSVEILVRTDRDTLEQSMTSAYMDIWNWSDIDFERISFNSNDAPQVVPMNFKVKKYKTLQFIVRNTAKNEGFGILGIIKRYVKGNYAKG